MSRWYEEWGSWLIAVVALIAFGVLIGYDLTSFSGAAAMFSAIGTLMLGVAALLAIPYWKKQEKQRFQASCAAAMHAEIAEVRHKLDTPVWLYIGNLSLVELETDEYEIATRERRGRELRDGVEEHAYSLLRVLNSSVIPRSVMLGVGFSTHSRELANRLTILLTESSWSNLGGEYLTDLLREIDDLLEYLTSKALFTG